MKEISCSETPTRKHLRTVMTVRILVEGQKNAREGEIGGDNETVDNSLPTLV